MERKTRISFSQVATYRIFCRAADRPNAKARMADTSYPGTGQQVSLLFSIGAR